jgi:hypothetical protein
VKLLSSALLTCLLSTVAPCQSLKVDGIVFRIGMSRAEAMKRTNAINASTVQWVASRRTPDGGTVTLGTVSLDDDGVYYVQKMFNAGGAQYAVSLQDATLELRTLGGHRCTLDIPPEVQDDVKKMRGHILTCGAYSLYFAEGGDVRGTRVPAVIALRIGRPRR